MSTGKTNQTTESGSTDCSTIPDIRPSHIETRKGHWYASFNSREREITAKLFVRACQASDSWTVTKEQLDNEDAKGSFRFNGMNQSGLIFDNRDGTYTASHEFICICYGKFPANSDS